VSGTPEESPDPAQDLHARQALERVRRLLEKGAMTPERILVVDPDQRVGTVLRAMLCARGFDVVSTLTLEDALALVPSFGPGALLVDVASPNGADTVVRLREVGSDAAVVAVAPRERVDAAVEALRAGAESYLFRPVEPVEALLALERALERRRLRREHAILRAEVRQRVELIGETASMRALRDLVQRVGPTRAPVLLVGEPGTGKARVAQAIHEASSRRDRPFVRLTCAGLSEPLLEAELLGHEAGVVPGDEALRAGAVEQANGGTLYLQEVGRLSHGLQLKLLRVLQTGELERVGGGPIVRVDVRIVASSQVDLAAAVEAGRFRQDLYYRLAVVSAQLPPLRARRVDLPALVAHFTSQATRDLEVSVDGLAPGALSAIFAYDWPGNVRELAEALRRAVAAAAGREISAGDLPPVVRGARAEADESPWPVPGATLEEIEREAILRALDRCGGSTVRAADLLGVSVRKVQYRLKSYRAGIAGRRRVPGAARAQ
jgi:two-component system NtrC family response regulator